MIPNFEFLGKTISVYMLMALAGILVTLFYTQRMAPRKGLSEIEALYMLMFAMLGAAIGGHILYGLTKFQDLVAFFTRMGEVESVRQFFQRLIYVFGGSVFYGGLLGGLLAGALYLRHGRQDLRGYGDLAAPAIPLFHTLGRIGCFLSGCCYGIP